MKYELSEICHYVKDKVALSELSEFNYVSTENMLPNKGGVVKAASLPSILQTQRYQNKDVLISNIRPYFKKIWYAKNDGGCSNDVLVLRANDGTDPLFLYYVLSEDAFFSYATSTAKGTKMPRGDKLAIMKYEVPVFDLKTQRKISKLLKLIDKKIELNNVINQNLEQQAQTLFKSWFIDFEPFGGSAPNNWTSIKFGEIATIKTDTFSPTKNPDKIVEHYSIPAYDEKRYPVFEPAANIKSNKYILTPMSVMISKLNPDTKRIWRPLCISDTPVSSTEFIVFEAVEPTYKDFIYSVLDSTPFYQYLCAHTTGSTNSRQRATPKATLDFPLLLPNAAAIQKFCGIVSPMYDLIAKNIMENQSLAYTRDSILPKLMSGELDVSSIDI